MITVQVHVSGQDPIKLDIEEMPSLTDIALIGSNPRDRADRDVKWVDDGVDTIIIPWSRINLIQVLPDKDAEQEFPLPFRND
jgi:hypothetical protein